ncbi:TPA: hypothetical protein ACGFAK_004626 [Serratia marcescens]|jgi:hypothetical protein|uniref:hypothetical protein n=1 Tax=Serratia TaxID=613 RepID=UPI00102225B9|nr:MULTISPECIES: hypothetical protein [Serratia]MBP1133534.1 hypothetical protein [Serratia sp. PL17]RYM67342.1 hypothetical protein BSQ99_24560 [Serratia liquefaciens]HBL7242129.1 hypothetical protein [Serratia liquefaciens]HDS5480592.1 hypothetical protein [Serratia liquefaciens]
MRYTVYVEYRNGAINTPAHSGVKEVAYRNFVELVADKDLLLTAAACVIKSSTSEILRFDLRTAQPIPEFKDIQWPRRGARRQVKNGKTVSAFLASNEEDFLKSLGEGSLTHGIRKAVSMLNLLEQEKLKALKERATNATA